MQITAELKPIYACTQEEKDKFISWVWELRDKNHFDMSVIGYPRACMCKAEDADGPLLFIPIHPVLMWESLAPKPELSKGQLALSLMRIAQEADKVMQLTGMHESYLLAQEEEYIATLCRHGFEEVKGFKLLKRKLNANTHQDNI